MSGQDDVPLMRSFGAGMPATPVHRGAEEVHAGIRARRVDVVVLGEVTHDTDD